MFRDYVRFRACIYWCIIFWQTASDMGYNNMIQLSATIFIAWNKHLQKPTLRETHMTVEKRVADRSQNQSYSTCQAHNQTLNQTCFLKRLQWHMLRVCILISVSRVVFCSGFRRLDSVSWHSWGRYLRKKENVTNTSLFACVHSRWIRMHHTILLVFSAKGSGSKSKTHRDDQNKAFLSGNPMKNASFWLLSVVIKPTWFYKR